MGKDSISWTERVFVALLLTFIRIDGASYLNGYCSLMFFYVCFFNVFIKVKKHVFNVFYLQSNVFNIYGW